jgi:hypothetical protein
MSVESDFRRKGKKHGVRVATLTPRQSICFGPFQPATEEEAGTVAKPILEA